MGALGGSLVTLADVAKSKNKQIGKVAEVLMVEHPMIGHIPYKEMNEGTRHIEEIRSGLATVYYRKANQAIPASKSTTEEREFKAAHFESKSQMDEKVANRGGADRVAYNRWNQAQGHIQAMANEHASLTMYGSPVSDARKVAGLTDFFGSMSASEPTSAQIIEGGGTTGDNTSIWKIHWGENSVFGIYPAGEGAGLKRKDRGFVQINALDSAGAAGSFWGYEEQFEIDHGLVLKDYRQVARIANIDPALLLSGASAADIIDLMISANYKIHSLNNGKGHWYMNRTALAFLHKQALTKVGAGGGLSFDNFEGKKILTFLGDPIFSEDTILNTEDRVT